MIIPGDGLEGKISLITGGSRGIGASIAIALAEAGSDIVINFLRHEEAAENVIETVRAKGRIAAKVRFDVTNFEETEAAIERINQDFGQVNILVNNAGTNRDRTFLKMSKDEWDSVLSVNLDGAFHVTKGVLPHMLTRGWGRIINISSIIGMTGNVGQCNYAASKAALIGFSKSLAKELAEKHITVNVVAPGFTSTEMVESLPGRIREQLLQMIPLKRFANPNEVGRLVCYLASPSSDYITGEVFTISGGLRF